MCITITYYYRVRDVLFITVYKSFFDSAINGEVRAPVETLLLFAGAISLRITRLKKYLRKKSSTFLVCCPMKRKLAQEAKMPIGMSGLARGTYRVVYAEYKEDHDHVDGEEDGDEG